MQATSLKTAAMLLWSWRADALTDWNTGTTINVGTIEGGTVANAVPAYARMEVDVRYLDPADFEKKKEQFEVIAGKVYIKDVTTKMTPVAGLEPMVRLDGNMKLFDVYKSVYEEEGFGSPKAITVGGGSDSAYTTMVGVPTVCAMGVAGATIRLTSLPMWNRCLCVPN